MADRSLADSKILSEIVARLAPIYRPERIYLFGSMARGDAGPDSDYDILLVMPDTAPQDMLAAASAYEALWGLGAAVEVHIWSHGRFESRCSLQASVPAEVIREGKLLYAV